MYNESETQVLVVYNLEKYTDLNPLSMLHDIQEYFDHWFIMESESDF